MFVKGYRFLSFAKIMCKNLGIIISKNLSVNITKINLIMLNNALKTAS